MFNWVLFLCLVGVCIPGVLVAIPQTLSTIERMSEFLTKPIVLASIALDTIYQVRIFHPTEEYNERRHYAIKRRTQISSLPGDRPSQR